MNQESKCKWCGLFIDDETHEDECAFNPVFKKCYSCCFHSFTKMKSICEKGLNCWDYKFDGNCNQWGTHNLKILRTLKLKKINEKLQ